MGSKKRKNLAKSEKPKIETLYKRGLGSIKMGFW